MSNYNCPNCSKKMSSKSSKFCKDCNRLILLEKSFENLDPYWLATFSGIFMSEGSLGIYYDNRGRGSYHPRASIHMRADEQNLFEDIYSHLGGSLHYEKARNNSAPQIVWVLNDLASIHALCLILEKHTFIPAKKLKDVSILKDYCEWRISQPLKLREWDYAKQLCNQLMKLRSYSDNS